MSHFIGQPVPSLTNRRLVAGKGQYTSDVKLDRMAHVAIVRSPLAAARVRGIDTSDAEALPGVLMVLTGESIREHSNAMTFNVFGSGIDAQQVEIYPLATDRVRFVGEPVAAVVAEDPYTAKQAALMVDVDYEELEPVVDALKALCPDSALVEPEWDSNVLFKTRFTGGDVDAAFAASEHVISGTLKHHRYTGTPLESRAYVADYDPFRDTLTFWASTQNPHPLRAFLSTTLGMSENNIRVIQPNVGGAFGLKIPMYQEEPLVACLARCLGRPVRWVAERREEFLTGGHARESHIDWSVGCDASGKVSALRARVVSDVGAPTALCGWGMAYLTAFTLPTVYRITNTDVELFTVVTNKCSWNAYRGFGKESSSFLMDRIMDAVARETGIDRAEVRLRNFIQPDEFPYPHNSGAMIDSGNYPGALKKLLKLVAYEDFAALKAEARAAGRYIGIGIGQELIPEGCALAGSQILGAYDGATVRVSPSGEVTVLTGVTSPGGGNETAMAQIAAEALGVEIAHVRVVQGDTETCPYGLGNYSSRGVIMGGSAVHLAATELREKMQRVAARMLEASVDDVEVEPGRFLLKGAPFRFVAFKDVAGAIYHDCHGMAACDEEPGLESTRYFRHGNVFHQPEVQGRYNAYPAWPNQAAACVVEVDPEDGMVRILRFVSVHDSGVVINPLTAEANVHGGIAQGIGGALYENLVYDDDGQLMTTTFMDYTLPTATELPRFEVAHQETPSPFTPLGTKGVGESGVACPLGALCAAVEDALEDFNVRIDALPLSPERIWSAIQAGQESAQ